MEPWRVPSRHTVKDGLSTWETMEKTLRAVRLALRGARATGGGLPGSVWGGTFEGTGVHCVCLSRGGPAGMGHPMPRQIGIRATPPWGPARATAKGGSSALRTGAARRSHGEAVRTAGHEDEDAAEDEGDPYGGGQGQRFMEKEDPEAGCGEGLREAEGSRRWRRASP